MAARKSLKPELATGDEDRFENRVAAMKIDAMTTRRGARALVWGFRRRRVERCLARGSVDGVTR